jgi:ribonuclease P protein subunit RPR2
MIRTAQERISDLFALADQESGRGHSELSDRYVGLARRIGMRYNVRLPAAYREMYCRSCSAHWVEGRSVRTRLRSGHRVRTCLRCGWVRRSVVGLKSSSIRMPRPSLRLGRESETVVATEALSEQERAEGEEEEE